MGLGFNVGRSAFSPKRWVVCPTRCKYNIIQEAINKANPGDTIAVKVGTYRENLVIDKDLTLAGEDNQKVKIKGDQEGRPILFIGPSTVTVKVKGITLLTEAPGPCVDQEEGICPNGITITGTGKAIVYKSSILGNGYAGISLFDLSQVKVEQSTVSDNIYGIDLHYTYYASQATITNSTISHNDIGISLSGDCKANVNGSKIFDNGGGIFLEDHSQAIIKKNEITDNRGSGITSRSDKEVAGSGNIITGNGVDLEGNLSLNIRIPLEEASQEKIQFPDQDYPTLQHAVDALLPGGTLIIEEGVYPGGLTIGKKLTIKARVKGEVYLMGGPVDLSLIRGANLILEGFRISGSDIGMIFGGTAKAIIRDSTITDNFWSGISLLDSSEAKIVNSRVTGSLGGILLHNSSEMDVVNSTVSGNDGVGVDLSDSSQAVIIDSRILDNLEQGILLSDSARLSIKNSLISDNVKEGIALADLSTANITENEITHNGRYGVTLKMEKCGFNSAAWEAFKGKVKGRGNHFSNYMRKPYCPSELSFLTTEEGGEYIGK